MCYGASARNAGSKNSLASVRTNHIPRRYAARTSDLKTRFLSPRVNTAPYFSCSAEVFTPFANLDMHCHANGSIHQKEVFVSQILLMRERRSLVLASFPCFKLF